METVQQRAARILSCLGWRDGEVTFDRCYAHAACTPDGVDLCCQVGASPARLAAMAVQYERSIRDRVHLNQSLRYPEREDRHADAA